jgi:curved DNA-binding protein CbpA
VSVTVPRLVVRWDALTYGIVTSDPYGALGVSPAASDAEVRAAYRRLVQRHHPDHNHGSAESARRFEEVQEAYAEVRRRRQGGSPGGDRRPGAGRRSGGSPPPPPPPRPTDPGLDARLAEMERELRAAQQARERAAKARRDAAAEALRQARADTAARRQRPSDEELGYYSSDDSFSKIIDDAAAELSQRWSQARHSPAGHRVADLIDELADKLTGERPDRPE